MPRHHTAVVTSLHCSPHVGNLRQPSLASDGLWRLSETLGRLTGGPAALEVVTERAGELTGADAAAIFLAKGREQVLASSWAAVTLPVGTKRSDLLTTLQHGFSVIAIEPVRDGSREIGGLWIGRAAGRPFEPAERLVLQKLAAMTSLAVTTLRERTRHQGAAGVVADAATGSDHGPEPHTRQATLDAALRTTLPTVPVFPPTLARLLAALDDSANEPEQIEAILRLDPVLAARVVRAAGSAACGRARPVASVAEAMLVLGVRGIRQMAIGQFTRSLSTQTGPIARLLWEQSVGTAVRTQTALEVGRPAAADAAYFGGLFRNVGTIVLQNAHPAEYERAVRKAIADDRPIVECERAELGTDGPAITADLLTRWQMPSRLLCILQAPRESLMAHALDWAEHATLAANPQWHAIRAAMAGVRDAGWLTTHLEHAVHELTRANLDPASLEARSAARIATTRQLLEA